MNTDNDIERQETRDALTVKPVDYVTSLAKGLVGAVPFAGSLLAELMSDVIPNQRMDRVVKFAAALEDRLSSLEKDFVQAQMRDQYFTDLLEEGTRQAAQSLTDERREYIANLIANGISSEDVEYAEAKHLMKLLGELSDVEVIWLGYYCDRSRGGNQGFYGRHASVLAPVRSFIGGTQSDADKSSLQASYKDHLVRLNLLRYRYEMDSKTKLPRFDSSTGVAKVSGYEATPLGRLLARHIGLVSDADRVVPEPVHP